MKALLFCAGILLNTVAFADHQIERDSASHQKRVHYYLTFGTGLLLGRNVGLTVNTVQGLRIGNRLSAGIGASFDAYEMWRVAPVFGSASWDVLGNKKNRVFVQLNYGYSFISSHNESNDSGHKKDEGGKMINPVIGYRVKYGDMRISFSLGYKFQRVVSYYNSLTFYPSCPYCNSVLSGPLQKEITTDMNRMVLDVAIGWK